uniref:Biliverdin binding protein-I n=1 Tax=Samia ricini TaxID=63990 RepID=Q8T118_SAMRI|nr:biliverdin binding protein-I [Samia ricini]
MKMLSLILMTIAVASAEVVLDGACPHVQPVKDFDINAYAGKWYEIKKLPLANEGKGQCAIATYTLDGDSLKVKNSHVINGVEKYVLGVAKKADDANGSGKLVLTVTVGKFSRVAPLWILTTDYTNYAVSYSCKYNEKNNTHRLNIWVLSKSKSLEGEAKAAVDSFLSTNFGNVDDSKFITIDFSENACKTDSSYVYTAPVTQ